MTKNNPVRPRNAASLVILRGHGADAEVLLGRREPRHSFMPNVFVFPGGRLDQEDGSAAVGSALKPNVARLLERQATPRRDHLPITRRRQNQIDQQCRYRLLLRDKEEPAQIDG